MAAPASAATPIAATVPPAIASPSRPSSQGAKSVDQKAVKTKEENKERRGEVMSDPF